MGRACATSAPRTQQTHTPPQQRARETPLPVFTSTEIVPWSLGTTQNEETFKKSMEPASRVRWGRPPQTRGTAKQHLCTRGQVGKPGRELSRNCFKPLAARGHQLLQCCHPGEEARGLDCALKPPGGGAASLRPERAVHTAALMASPAGYSYRGKSRSK